MLKYLDKALDATGSFRQFAKRGLGLMAGADPHERIGDYSSWKFLGNKFTFGPDSPLPTSIERLDKGVVGSVVAGVLGMGFTVGGSALSYQEDGVIGVMENLGMEAAASAGVAATAYKVSRAGEVGMRSFGVARIMAGVGGGVMAGSMVGGPIGMAIAAGGGALGGTGYGLAAGVGALGLAAGGFASYGAYSILKAGAVRGYQHHQNRKSLHTAGSMAAFNTRGAHTMRSRAVQAISKSHMNSRSALGSEANYMHFPSRSYNSRYRRV